MHVSPELAQPLRPEPAQRDQAAEREQRLVRRHVRRRLLAPDVLLARLQREDEAAPALEVGRLADDPAGHAADELLARGEEAVVRAAVATGSSRSTGPRRSPSRSRSCPAPRAGRARRGRRARRAARRPRSRRRRARGRARGSRRRSAAGRSRPPRPPPRPRARAGSVVPPSCGTSTTSMPKPGAYVFTTWRTCGLSVSASTTFVRPVW